MNNPVNGGGATPRHNLFDFFLYAFAVLCPIMLFSEWDINMVQRLFFVFGTFALFGITFFCKEQRSFKNIWIGLIVLWSLISVFIHSWRLDENSVVSGFLNFSLMSEGFIYVLCGCLLYYMVARYSLGFNIAYPLIVISLVNLVFAVAQKFGVYWVWHNAIYTNQSNICGILGTKSNMAVFSAVSIPVIFGFNRPLSVIPTINLILSNSFTALVALLIGITVFLFLRRYHRFLFIFVLVVACFTPFIKWHKFYIRPPAWQYALNEIKRSPIFGHGFDNTIMQNKIVLNNVSFEHQHTYRHNDYLNVARDLGVPFLVFILMACAKTMLRTRMDYLWLSLVVLSIACFAQTSFYYPRIASVGIIMLALKAREHGTCLA